MIVVDTNIVIAFLGGEDAIVTRLKEAVAADMEIALPTIVIAEVLSYPGIDDTLRTRTYLWLQEVTILTLDLPIADRAAAIRRSTKLKLIDSIVVATAVAHHAKVATRDQEFTQVKGLEILSW